MNNKGVKILVKFGNVEDFDFEDEKILKEVLAAKKRLDGMHEIVLLQDYINLLNDIAKVTDEQYRVYDHGTVIVCWED